MFNRIVSVAIILWGFTCAIAPTLGQNLTCPDRPSADSSNACANTRWVKANGGGGGGTPGGSNGQVQYNNAGAFGGLTNTQLTADINVFSGALSGAATASGGGTINFLRADGTWAIPGGGSAIVGTILPWAGATVPTGYLLAYGQAVSRSTYSALLSALTLNTSITCTSGSPTITVSADIAARATIGAPIEASGCFAAGTTVVGKGATSLVLSNNASASTTALMSVFPWGNGDASTTFNLPNLQGRALVGRDNMSGTAAGTLTSTYYTSNPDALAALGGTQSKTLITANLPAYTPSGVITNGTIFTPNNANTFNNFSSTGGGDFPIPTAQPATINPSQAASTFTGIAQGGTSTPFSAVQPSVTIDWIIKALPDTVVPSNGITVGTTTVVGGLNTNIIYNNNGVVGEYPLATAAQYNSAASGVIVQPSVVFQAETTTTYGTTTTFDFNTFKNTKVTLTGNITTQTLSNVIAGKAGLITFIQDGTGSRTTVWNSIFKFSGGTAPTLTTTAGAVDILTYACRSATFCGASLLTDVK